MRLFFLFAVLMLTSPALAQEQSADDWDKRVALSKRMHEIWPVEDKVEKGLDDVARRLREEDREKFKTIMRSSMDMEVLEKDSVDAMAQTFTAEELQTMVDFYGSDIGNSISSKVETYQKRLEPSYNQMIDKALMALRTGNASQTPPQ